MDVEQTLILFIAAGLSLISICLLVNRYLLVSWLNEIQYDSLFLYFDLFALAINLLLEESESCTPISSAYLF